MTTGTGMYRGAQSRLLSGAAADVVVCAYVWASIHTFSPVVMISPSPIVYTYLTSPANRTVLRFRNLGVFNPGYTVVAYARRQATAHIAGDDEGIVTVPDTPPRALTTITVDTLAIRLSPEHRRP